MNTYKLAVIIPSWNCSKFIGKMLESIIANTFDNWKCIVVDDQSTDNTVEVIKRIQEKDARIELVSRHREPKGAQTCRNIGFELSEGAEYVIWLDADDLTTPYCFEQRVCYMDRHRELDFGIFPAITFKERPWEEEAFCYGFPFWEDTLQAMLSWTLPMVGWTNIYRRQSLIRARHIWDEKIKSMQDSDFNIHSILLGMKYDYAVKEEANVDYYYRTKSNVQRTSSKLFIKEHFDSHLYLLYKLANTLSPNQRKVYKNELEIYYYKFAKLFSSSGDHYHRFLRNPWIKENFIYKMRLILWKWCNFSYGDKIFFRYISNRDYLRYTRWYDMMKKKYAQLIDKSTSRSENDSICLNKKIESTS